MIDKELIAKVICIEHNKGKGCSESGSCVLLSGGTCNTWKSCLERVEYIIRNLKQECK